MEAPMQAYLPILILAVVAVGFVAVTTLASYWLGPKRHSEVKDNPFECGIASVDNARMPFSVKYFLIAILFVLFDVEIIFFYPWAVNFRALGWTGFGQMACFVVTVVIGFAYIVKNRVFDFEKD